MRNRKREIDVQSERETYKLYYREKFYKFIMNDLKASYSKYIAIHCRRMQAGR